MQCRQNLHNQYPHQIYDVSISVTFTEVRKYTTFENYPLLYSVTFNLEAR